MIPIQGFFPYFLALFPGLGHLFLKRPIKTLAYGIPFWLIVIVFFYNYFENHYSELLFFLFVIDVILWLICFIDSLLTIQKIKATYSEMGYGDPTAAYTSYGAGTPAGTQQPPYSTGPAYQTAPPVNPYQYDPERSKVMMMSFIPGLAHFHLGMMQRGLSVMALFFGIPIFIFFVVGMTGGDSFLSFLLALPVILFYAMYDVLSQLKRKQAGLELVDRSIFEDFYQNRSGQKSRTVATLLSIFPGAGHLYVGMQIRGIQLMIAFILSLYMLDVLRFSVFLFLIPILWFFSFFDALQMISGMERGEVTDKPIVTGLKNYQRWVGLSLLLLGLYVIFDRLSPLIFEKFFANKSYYYLVQYFDVSLVSLILIVSGIVLLFGKKKK